MPRGCEGDDALARNKVRRGDRHRPAKAIADQRGGFGDAAQQGKQQMFDMSRNIQVAPVLGLAPVEQEHVAAHSRNGTREGHVFVEVQDSRRIDQRWNEKRRRTAAPMVTQTGPTVARNLWLAWRPRTPRGSLIRTQTGECIASEFGVMRRDVAYQIEKQRQRPRRVFMLQRTMLR